MALAGLILLVETFFGMIAFVWNGYLWKFWPVIDAVTVLGVIMGFPIYLVGFRSLRAAMIGLWLLFVVQWVDMYFSFGVPRCFWRLLDGWYGELLLIAILLTTISYIVARELSGDKRSVTFMNI
jgi:hypothetical protein